MAPSPAALAQPPIAFDPATANLLGNTGGSPDEPPGISLTRVDGQEPTMETMPDGGVVIDVQPSAAERPSIEHDANLAEYIPDDVLNTVATQVIDWVKADQDSRQEWYSTLTEGMKLLGIKIEDRSFPFEGASGVYDTLMLEAVIRNQGQTSSELLPAAGPVKTEIIGSATEDVQQKADRVASWFNYYLLEGAPEWVENMEQMFFWRALCGSTFKKVYQDPILQRPVSPFITPDKLVVNYYSDAEMESCQRITHILNHSYKEVRERQMSGFYRDVSLMPPEKQGTPNVVQSTVDNVTGVRAPEAESALLWDKEFELYEQHVDLDLEGFEHTTTDDNGETTNTGLPLPYIVTIETTSRKVLAIRRNWQDGDKSFQKQMYFVHYRFIPGLGFYGLGFAHLLGNPAKAATALQRQMIDAATLEMFPGGLRVKGMRMDDNNKMVGPCEFIEIDTGGLPINQAVTSMPYKGPSEVSFNLWQAGRQNAQSLGNMADISVGDGRQDAPVGTTLALLEAANRMMSATIKSAHRSMKREFKLFAALFGQYLPETPYPFPVQGGQKAIMKQDFSDQIGVIPVSDPNITSYAQRVTQAEARLRIAQQFPQVHDMRAACQQMYVAMGTNEAIIGAILPLPQQAVPTDPLTENQMALTGKPIAAGLYQDHKAHIAAHQVLSEQVPTIAAHISEHLGMQMRMNVEQLLGTQLPPPGTKLPPEIENRIAVMVAQALQHLQSPQGQEPTPGQIALAEIQVEAQKVQAQLQKIAAAAASTAYAEQKRQQTANADRQSRERIAMYREQTAQAREKSKQMQIMQRKNSIGRQPTSFQ